LGIGEFLLKGFANLSGTACFVHKLKADCSKCNND